jgi:hypothetical protein
MIGRLVAIGTSTYSSSSPIITELTDTAAQQQYSLTWPLTDRIQLAMWDNQGFPTVVPGTPFRLAFDGANRSLRVNADIEPGDYWIAQISFLPLLLTPYYSILPIYPGIGMLGWREEAY